MLHFMQVLAAVFKKKAKHLLFYMHKHPFPQDVWYRNNFLLTSFKEWDGLSWKSCIWSCSKSSYNFANSSLWL